MLDIAIKNFLKPTAFSPFVYWCSFINLLLGMALISYAFVLYQNAAVVFVCDAAPESTRYTSAIYDDSVNRSCYLRYQMHMNYNSPMPFCYFAVLSTGWQIFVAIVYSIIVRRRIEYLGNQPEPEDEAENQVQSKGFYSVRFHYLFHLVIRFLSGILFTILQHTLLYPSGFDSEYSCSLQSTTMTSTISKIAENASAIQSDATFFACKNPQASEEEISWIAVSVLNMFSSSIMLIEMVRLCRRFSRSNGIADRLLRSTSNGIKVILFYTLVFLLVGIVFFLLFYLLSSN